MRFSRLVPVTITLFAASTATARQLNAAHAEVFMAMVNDEFRAATATIEAINPDGAPGSNLPLLGEEGTQDPYHIIAGSLIKFLTVFTDASISMGQYDEAQESPNESPLSSDDGERLINRADSPENGPIRSCETYFTEIYNVMDRLPEGDMLSDLGVCSHSNAEAGKALISQILRALSQNAATANNRMMYTYMGSWMQENQREELMHRTRWCEFDILDAWARWSGESAPEEPTDREADPQPDPPQKRTKRCLGSACQA